VSILKYILKLIAVVLIAISMGWVGFYCLFLGQLVPDWNDFWTQYVITASVLIWTLAFFLKGSSSISSWGRFGLFSPVLGCLLVAPPASFALLITRFYVAFPIGIATGFIIGTVIARIDRIGTRSI
jgi:hypothetical protein